MELIPYQAHTSTALQQACSEPSKAAIASSLFFGAHAGPKQAQTSLALDRSRCLLNPAEYQVAVLAVMVEAEGMALLAEVALAQDQSLFVEMEWDQQEYLALKGVGQVQLEVLNHLHSNIIA